MLKNNLAKIMIDKKLTQTKLSKDTGIARSTISRIAKNDSEMLDISTIDSLCVYLGVKPNEFFEYVPYVIKYSIDTIDFNLEYKCDEHYEIYDFSVVHRIELYIEVFSQKNRKVKEFQLKGKIDENAETIGLIPIGNIFASPFFEGEVFLFQWDNLNNEEELYIDFIDELPPTFQNEIIERTKEVIKKLFFEEFKNEVKQIEMPLNSELFKDWVNESEERAIFSVPLEKLPF